MKSESTGPILSTVFVDYDNIYLSLKRKNEDAAKRFAKDAGHWLKELESGRLLFGTNGTTLTGPRRIVMSRCYGNPVPRRNTSDNSTDMNSFPFVRHHFLRAGFEVIDCPPLTAQLKNSADIRMVMDVRDMLTHETRFDEFIIISGDADFTPVLHRLRAHARRTIVFANDHTAAPYTAISDGEVREVDLIGLLLEGRVLEDGSRSQGELRAPVSAADLDGMRREIVAEVVAAVRGSSQPLPLEALADRAVRTLGHDRTAGSAWGGAGGFRDLLAKSLPADIRLTETAPYFVYQATRQIARDPEMGADLGSRPDPRTEARSDFRTGSEFRAAPEFRTAPEGRYAPSRDEARYEAPRAAAPVAPQSRPDAHRELRVPLGQDMRAEPRFDRSLPAGAEFAPQSYPAAPQQSRVPAYGSYEGQTSQPAPRQSQYEMPAARQAGFDAKPRPSYDQAPAPRSSYAAAPPAAPQSRAPAPQAPMQQAPIPQAPAQPAPRSAESASQLQQSISRIHEACQAPPLSPPEYRVLFEVMAEEINANNLSGSQTLVNIAARAREMGIEVKRDDIRFVLEVVSEPDPWFEQGASANLFASRFRNFVVARCRSQGLTLSADEIDLVDAWFGGAAPSPQQRQAPAAPHQPQYQQPAAGGGYGAPQGGADEEFPRIVRSRLRG